MRYYYCKLSLPVTPVSVYAGLELPPFWKRLAYIYCSYFLILLLTTYVPKLPLVFVYLLHVVAIRYTWYYRPLNKQDANGPTRLWLLITGYSPRFDSVVLL